MGKSRMIFHELGGDKDEWEAFEDEVHIIGWESDMEIKHERRVKRQLIKNRCSKWH
jgi:hypothetical protein